MNDVKKLMARIPWESGNTTGYVIVDAQVKGPEYVTKDVSNTIGELLKREYGADVRISTGSEP